MSSPAFSLDWISVTSESGSGCCTVDASLLLALCARNSYCSATVSVLGTSTSCSGGLSPGPAGGLVGAVTDGVDSLAVFAFCCLSTSKMRGPRSSPSTSRYVFWLHVGTTRLARILPAVVFTKISSCWMILLELILMVVMFAPPALALVASLTASWWRRRVLAWLAACDTSESRVFDLFIWSALV